MIIEIDSTTNLFCIMIECIAGTNINNMHASGFYGLILIYVLFFLSSQDELMKYIKDHMWSPDYSPLVYPFAHV